jgi:hypothetical protein
MTSAVAVILLGAGLSASVSAQSTPEASPAALSCWAADQVMEDPTLGKQYAQPPAMKIDPAKTYTATIETNKGTVTAELFPADAPNTVNNFVCLADDGYFKGTPFHRIV